MTNALKNQAFSATPANTTHFSRDQHADSARLSAAGTVVNQGEKDLQKQASNLIGQTFYGTLLKQMHDSPFKSDLFSGGRGGEAFSGMLDQTLATRMAQRSGEKLTRPIVRKFKAAAVDAYEKNQKFKKDHSTHVANDYRA